jgi:UDP-N-acetylglucosamine transferase subunit ALG13
LNWGLGHATRCIPLIRALINEKFEPVLAGDGASLKLLASEFPELRTYELPSYGIRYAKSPGLLKLKLLSQLSRIQKAVSREHTLVQEIVEKEKATGIISDNRFGVWSNVVPSVYLTHQLQVRAGMLTSLSSSWHQRIISKFERCWVCDFKGDGSLAGELSSNGGNLNNLDWIGPLSRFSEPEPHSGHTLDQSKKTIDISVVLSGPEPSRSKFEKKVIEVLKGRKEKVVLVRGVTDSQACFTEKNLTIHNFMLANKLEKLIRQSRLLIVRSGYSSIMDLHALGARALLVPTPGQSEQEYLAESMREKGRYPTVKQSEFDWNTIQEALEYPWSETKKTSKRIDYAALFDVFLQET